MKNWLTHLSVAKEALKGLLDGWYNYRMLSNYRWFIC